MPLSLPFLSVGPKVRIEQTRLTATTSWLMRILTLGAWIDDIDVDSRRKLITIRRKRFWFYNRTRVIAFDNVQHVAYSLIDQGSLLGDERGYSELFDVALTLHTGEELALCRFSGDGEYVADVSLPTEWLGDRIREVTDVRGRQQEHSLGFADLLAERIGVGLGPSKYF